MKIGFDLDGTLDRPELVTLCNTLYAAGHEIHIITVGRFGDGYSATREQKIEKLEWLGAHYHYLHMVGGDGWVEAGTRKATVVSENGISLFIDDSSTFCTAVSALTSAVVLRVRPPAA